MKPSDDVPGRDRLNSWLEAALHEYGRAEPRIGLEGRVLANLAATAARVGVRGHWWLLGAAAAMFCLGILVWIGGLKHGSSGKIAANAASAEQKTDAVTRQSDVKLPAAGTLRPHSRTPFKSGRSVGIERAPRLNQFPSSRGLSEQERLLVRYVTESPGEAVMVAEEQAERQKELRRLTGESDSDQ